MKSELEQIAVVYLARLRAGGLESIKNFFASYSALAAGVPHHLIIAAKGWESEDQVVLLQKIPQRDFQIVRLADDGFDLGAYFRIAEVIADKFLCFFNTHSVILGENWLRHLYSAARCPGVGAVGATGSWESLYDSPREMPRTVSGYAHIKRKIMHTKNRMQFPRFPNPHLRTNAFIVRRDLFREFAARTRFPKSKRDVYTIESGAAGFSSFLKGKQLEFKVCALDGTTYRVEQWPESGTFRSQSQRNLLVADNQTRNYVKADAALRLALQRAAWGCACG